MRTVGAGVVTKIMSKLLEECSSIGRAPVSKTGGWGVPPLPKQWRIKMKNPLKFFQDVKQEAFKVTWPTGKRVFKELLW